MEQTDVATIQSEATETSSEAVSTDTVEETTTSQSETEDVSTSDEAQETETSTAETTQEEEQQTDWEKSYKELQAEYTRKSQELSDLRKKHEPQIVDDSGKPTSVFEQNFNFQLDDFEFSSYLSHARYLNADDRDFVEDTLKEAERYYLGGDRNTYKQLLNEVKGKFNPEFIESITEQKARYKSQKQEYIDKAVREQRIQNANNVAAEIEGSPELFNLVNPESKSYLQPVYDIIESLFHVTGKVDVKKATEAVKAIREQAVNEYKASLAINKQKQQANVVTGEGNPVENAMPTRLQIHNMSQAEYNDFVEKHGFAAVMNAK